MKRQSERELFRFGNGGVQDSNERWRLPTVLGGCLFLFWTSVRDVPSLGLLFGRDFLDGVGAVLNFHRRLLRCDRLDTGHIPLRQLAAGHFLLEIIPKEWTRPGSLRWRKLGQDGVIEMQLSMNDWLKQRFGNSNPFHPKEHEHLVAESSMSAADRAHSGMLPATTCLNLPALARGDDDNFVFSDPTCDLSISGQWTPKSRQRSWEDGPEWCKGCSFEVDGTSRACCFGCCSGRPCDGCQFHTLPSARWSNGSNKPKAWWALAACPATIGFVHNKLAASRCRTFEKGFSFAIGWASNWPSWKIHC